MKKHASYILSNYSSIKSLTPEKLLQVGTSQAGEEIPIPSFDENLLINMCNDAKNIFENEKTVLEIVGDTIVVGDIHGSLHDLLRILKYIESNTCKVIFLGDYIDRGNFSLECITLLFSLKIMQPSRYFLLRGNHEFDVMCSQYGFKKEILNYHNPKKMYKLSNQNSQAPIPERNIISFEEDVEEEKEISTEKLCDSYFANHIHMNCYKYTEKLYDSFLEAFSYLPIAAIVNKTSLCLHGGLSPLLENVKNINKLIKRPIYNYDENVLLCDILWGDPSVELRQFFECNPRGRGQLFNGVVVVNFLKNNNLQRLIRAHQCVLQGTEKTFNEKCITVFSASSYNCDMGNYSGILKLLEKDDRIEHIKFDPLHRLKKYEAFYYKVQAFEDSHELRHLHSTSRISSMASYGFFNRSMVHSRSIDNGEIVLKDNEESSILNEKLQLVKHHSPHCMHGSVVNKLHANKSYQARKIHHCSSLLPKTIHSRINFTHLKNLKIDEDEEENVNYHSENDERVSSPPSQKCLPRLTPDVYV